MENDKEAQKEQERRAAESRMRAIQARRAQPNIFMPKKKQQPYQPKKPSTVPASQLSPSQPIAQATTQPPTPPRAPITARPATPAASMPPVGPSNVFERINEQKNEESQAWQNKRIRELEATTKNDYDRIAERDASIAKLEKDVNEWKTHANNWKRSYDDSQRGIDGLQKETEGLEKKLQIANSTLEQTRLAADRRAGHDAGLLREAEGKIRDLQIDVSNGSSWKQQWQQSENTAKEREQALNAQQQELIRLRAENAELLTALEEQLTQAHAQADKILNNPPGGPLDLDFYLRNTVGFENANVLRRDASEDSLDRVLSNAPQKEKGKGKARQVSLAEDLKNTGFDSSSESHDNEEQDDPTLTHLDAGNVNGINAAHKEQTLSFAPIVAVDTAPVGAPSVKQSAPADWKAQLDFWRIKSGAMYSRGVEEGRKQAGAPQKQLRTLDEILGPDTFSKGVQTEPIAEMTTPVTAQKPASAPKAATLQRRPISKHEAASKPAVVQKPVTVQKPTPASKPATAPDTTPMLTFAPKPLTPVDLWQRMPWWLTLVFLIMLLFYVYLVGETLSMKHMWLEANDLTRQHVVDLQTSSGSEWLAPLYFWLENAIGLEPVILLG